MTEDHGLEPGMRRTLVIALLLCAVFFAGFTILARHVRKAPPEPLLPVYPRASNVKHWLIEQTGYQKTVFDVAATYPSAAVYEYYRTTLERQGYTPYPPDQRPSWQLSDSSIDANTYTFIANWADPKRLHGFDLTINATEKVTRDPNTKRLIHREIVPGMQVICVLSRKIILGD
jgi:hypothetical protein